MRFDAQGTWVGRISENYYVFNEVACADEDGELVPMEIIPVPTLAQANTPGFVLPWGPNDLAAQTEHVVDRQVMLEFFKDITEGTLKSGSVHNLDPIDGAFFKSKQKDDPDNFEEGIFHKLYPGLGKEPALNPGGIQHDVLARRAMELFGTNNNPLPFLYCDPLINGAKGRIMRGYASSGLDPIKDDALVATTTDTQEAYDRVIYHFRLANATWEYMRVAEFGRQFNLVRQGVRSQLSLIEKHTEIQDLVAWWDLWSPD